MGLDGVELIMAWEESFGITITSAEASELRTPRLVVDLIYQKLRSTSQEGECFSQHCFYRLRKAFHTVADTPRAAFMLDARLADLLPVDHRKIQWRQLGEAMQIPRFPALMRPFWCQGLLTVLFFGSFALFSSCLKPAGISFFFPAFLLACVVCWTSFLVTRPLRYALPSDYKTPRKLTKHLVAYHAKHVKTPESGWSREAVRTVVRECIIEQLGIKEFSDDDDFVRDLRVG